ncbi:MAG: DDE-type integrase/transposase/recombinase [Candidatus Caldarchaeum sp.]
MDEAAAVVKGLLAWVWVAYEPFSKRTLGFWLSWTRNSIQAVLFLRTLAEAYGRHSVWTDGDPRYSEACARLGLSHRRYRFGGLTLSSRGEGCTDTQGYEGKLRRPFPMQKESMHSRACLDMAKPIPAFQPARDTKPDGEHKKGDKNG